VDLEAPYARHNLNKLLFRLYQDSPYLRIFVNKWQEWDDFTHKDNPAAPRATFFPGAFQVFLERKLVNSYNMYSEKRRKVNDDGTSSHARSKIGSSHSSYVDSEMRQSVESQIEQFNNQKANARTSIPNNGMFEMESSDGGGEDDPLFNAEEIAFKVRQQCHRDRKVILNKMISSGQLST
jgi:hypothetical protein